MESSLLSSKKQDSTAHTSEPTCRIPSFLEKPKAGVLGLSPETEAQNFLLHTSFSSPIRHDNDDKGKEAAAQKDNGRERLKRHREEIAGNVRIPEKWNQEKFLMDWIDYSSFDKLLAPNGIASAREALMGEARRASSQRLRIEIK